VHRRLAHFASREAVDIDGLGEALIQQLIENDLISKIEDIYQLDYDQVLSLERQGSRSVENLKRSIERSKEQKFYKILFGLGIRYVGEKTARLLAEHFGDIDSISQAGIDELMQVEEVGEKIAESVSEFFANPLNQKMIKALKEAGVNLKQEKTQTGSKLLGRSFLVTGTLKGYSRQEIKDKILSEGGKVVSSVTKNLDYLIAGENPGSKLSKAEKLGSVQIISEKEFEEMLG
jgi:DNA ligase (NAD+)